ncbi:MAG TPA: hypothetical protein VKZ50_06025 [bacterium]|nr:hypothetical protein [bacterium]
MSAERAPWKIVVLALTAVVGLGLAIDGAHTPALNQTLSGIERAATAAGSAGTRATGGSVAPASPDDRAGGGPSAVLPGRGDGAGPDGEAGERGSAERGETPTPPLQTTSAGPASGSPSPAVGPLLSQMWYASRAYQVYPAIPSAQTDRALTGFRLSFRDVSPTTEEVAVTNLQDNTSQPATFDRTSHLYFIETRMGDDGVDGETNLSDDGFVLTDPQGHIIGQ